MERTIRVTGKGRLSVRPDTVRLILSLEGKETEYAEALRQSSEMTEALKTLLEDFGFSRQDLKTLAFSVETVYESYQDEEDRAWKQRFDGYQYSHRMKVEFPADNARLGRILYALGRSSASPEIRIEYTVADPESVRNELLARAVSDAKEKAAVLAGAAGVILGEIVTVDYSWAEAELVSRPMNRMLGMSAKDSVAEESYSLDIEADDIKVTDTVTVIWEIR